MIHVLRELALGSMVVLMCYPSLSQQQEGEKECPSNLELIRSLAVRIGNTVGRDLGQEDSATVSVTVLPKDLAWYVEGALLNGLSKNRLNLRASGSTMFAAEFGLGSARVEYTNIRREGFFGSKVVDRTVSVLISAKVVDLRKGNIVITRDYEEEQRDTVQLSEIDRVESAGLALTHGAVPGEGFFSTLAEPLVLLGAIGVAVYLLFSVRS